MKKFTKKFVKISSFLIVLGLALASCQPAETPIPIESPEDVDLDTPTEEMTEEMAEKTAEWVHSITNPRQNLQDGNVIIDKVVMDQQGWVVIHADDSGQPGPVIGYIEVPEGVSTEVVVQVVPKKITPTLYAMLHVDAEPLSEFNFPEGDDVPVTVEDEVVTKAFDSISEADLESSNGE
jgi:formylmethanofuran dehydrogenase subunit D